MFEREHHQRIARVLHSLDADVLYRHACWFGGGTAIALREGEYRESVDIDMLVSDPGGYRGMRELLAGAGNLAPITRPGHDAFAFENEARADRYGIRAFVVVDGTPIKFEIVHEGRIEFDMPGRADKICGIQTLSRLDLAACKLLANSDRWRDDSVYARDVIDLAMLDLQPRKLRPAWLKARQAYGAAILRDLGRALAALRERPGWLEQCIRALSINLTPAGLQQKIRRLDLRYMRLEATLAS